MKTYYKLAFTDKRNGSFDARFFSLKKAEIVCENVCPLYPNRTIEIRKITPKENISIEAWQYSSDGWHCIA